MKVNMTPNPLDVVTIHASQGDTEARQWEFELHNNGELIDTSDVKEQLVFKAYKGGTEQILPENGSVPTTSPIIAEIKYPHGEMTDQEFLYRESPTEEDGLAKVTDIKGNTLVWNQLVQNGNFADSTNNWEAGGSSTISASNGELTVTIGGAWNNDARQNRSLVAGHKYLGTFKVKSDTLTNIGVSLGQFGAVTNVRFASTETLSSAYQTVVGIATITESTSVIRCSLTANASSYTGQTFTIKDVMLFDLTQMGLDITDPSDFTSLFPLSYYAYNQGSLLSFMGNGIKTTGKNLLNLNIADGTYLGLTVKKEDDGSVSINGRTTSSGNIYLMNNTGNDFYVPNDAILSTNVASHGEYDVKLTTLENTSIVSIGNESLSANVPKGWYKGLRLYFANGRDYNLNLKLMIAFDSTDYDPYTSTTTSLPISTYFPTGMKSAGSVYDELTPRKAKTRISSFVINGNSVNYHGTASTGTRYVSGNAPQDAIPNSVNIKTVDYLPITTAPTNSGYIRFLATSFYLYDNAFTDLATAKSILNANPVTVYYESATPTETPITTASLVTENGEIPLSNEDGVLIGKCTEQLSENPGFFDAKIKLSDADGECYSNKIQLHVERSPQ